jgi:hypothetical protein
MHQQIWGYKVEWKSFSRGTEGKRLNTTVLMGFHRSTFSKPNTEFNSDLWAFPTMKRELRGKKFRNDQRSVTRVREVGGAL